jgi:hypothetical protein
MPRGEHLIGKGGKLFKKGEPSPNPSGRPKGESVETIIKRFLAITTKVPDPFSKEEDEAKKPIVELSYHELTIIAQLKKSWLGDTAAAEWLHSRGYGKMVQQQVVSVNAAHNLRYQNIESPADFKAAFLAIEEEERRLEEDAAND